jgi:hypothetical protein
MTPFLNYVTLDSVIREACGREGDYFAHTYMPRLALAVAFIRDCDHSFGGFKSVKYLWLPVTDGRAYMQEVVNVTKVGVRISGHIQPLLEDQNMLDRPDDCGGLTTDRPMNPDIPSVRSTGLLPVLNTGQVGGGGVDGIVGGYGYTGGSGWGGLYGMGWDLTYPGMGIKKSLYGYFRWFPGGGYFLLDADSNWEEIVIECAVKTFEPGSITLVPELCVESIIAYIRWAQSDLDSDVSTKERPLLPGKTREYGRQRMLLRDRMNRIPLHELWAVVR